MTNVEERRSFGYQRAECFHDPLRFHQLGAGRMGVPVRLLALITLSLVGSGIEKLCEPPPKLTAAGSHVSSSIDGTMSWAVSLTTV
jgi:hypothetical protein